MLNIDVLTYGHEFKDDNGNIYKITDHIASDGKINIQLEEQVVPLEENKPLELIEE